MISTLENTEARPVSLSEIEANAKAYRAVFDRAEKLKATVEREQQAVLNSHAKELDALAHELYSAHANLGLTLMYGREHFKKPKTQTFHRVVVGFEKGRDKVECPDDEILIPRIEKLLKAKASTLIRTVKSLVRDAFNKLPKAELQMLGCQSVTGADHVVIRPETSSDVQKYFDARLQSVVEKGS